MPGMSLHVDAWHVHQCEHGKGKGTERMLMLLSPCSAAQVMGLEGCVGVHSTSRPPPNRFIFPAVAIDCGLEVCRHRLAYLFFYVYSSVISRGIDMVTELEIDKSKRDIPLARVVYAYPYEEMDVGDSFTVPVEARQKVMNANYRASKRLGCKYTCRTEGELVRVWRVA